MRDTAGAVTAGATTDYDRRPLLQDWFRNNFTYSLEVPAGHGNERHRELPAEPQGYCEQFAGTFAAMAARWASQQRVAVGFTPGRQQADGWYRVLGRKSHAWPEMWFDGIGWVTFEPTPRRGDPGAEDYTGVAAAQDDSVPDLGTPEPGAVTLPPTPTIVLAADHDPAPHRRLTSTPNARSGFTMAQQRSASADRHGNWADLHSSVDVILIPHVHEPAPQQIDLDGQRSEQFLEIELLRGSVRSRVVAGFIERLDEHERLKRRPSVVEHVNLEAWQPLRQWVAACRRSQREKPCAMACTTKRVSADRCFLVSDVSRPSVVSSPTRCKDSQAPLPLVRQAVR